MVRSAVLKHSTEEHTNHTLSAPSAASCGAKDEEVSRSLNKSVLMHHSMDEEQTRECTWRASVESVESIDTSV